MGCPVVVIRTCRCRQTFLLSEVLTILHSTKLVVGGVSYYPRRDTDSNTLLKEESTLPTLSKTQLSWLYMIRISFKLSLFFLCLFIFLIAGEVNLMIIFGNGEKI